MTLRALAIVALCVGAVPLAGCRPNASPPSAAPPEAMAQPAPSAAAGGRGERNAGTGAAAPGGVIGPERDGAATGQGAAGGDGAASGEAHDGGALYATYCALCHGDRGQGYAADAAHALANPELLATATDAFLRDAITEGRPGTPMSAWGVAHGGPLSDPEVDAVVHYLRAWQTTPSVALSDASVRGSALRGQAVYDANCAACHGPEAAGGVAVGLANPRFLASASDQFLRYAIEHGRTGTPMPAWGGVLRRQQIDDVVVYLRSLARAPGELPEAAAELDLSGALLNPSGGAASFELREGRFVAADDVKAALDAGARLVVLDARARSDFAAGHIAGASNLPFYESAGHLESLPRDAWIITYCGCPHAVSGQLADALIAAGFAQVAVLDEGYFVWRQRGYPVVEPTVALPARD